VAEDTAPSAEAKKQERPAASTAPATPTATRSSAAAVEVAGLSPAVRRIVKEHGLSVADLRGSGPKGRITKEDALRAAETKKKTRPAPPQVAAAAAVSNDGQGATSTATRMSATERQTRVPMSRLRQTIASRLVQARHEIALLTTFNEINMENVMDLRKRYGEQFEKNHGVRLGFMSFFVKVCCQALQRFPAVNAMIDGQEIVYNNFYDIGVAVSTERGLLVPVLRDADMMSFAEIEKDILDLAQRARDKKIAPDELAGGTFTITNGGVFGSLLSTPLPNYPQTAILGMHAIQKRPIAVNDQVVIKPMMYVALSYDHRMIDGREAVQFLVAVKSLIEDPQALLLDV
jgi:2-oxoglutarate dehydrogenase E2 component (dihydrolipoamide succinyltransferase)